MSKKIEKYLKERLKEAKAVLKETDNDYLVNVYTSKKDWLLALQCENDSLSPEHFVAFVMRELLPDSNEVVRLEGIFRESTGKLTKYFAQKFGKEIVLWDMWHFILKETDF